MHSFSCFLTFSCFAGAYWEDLSCSCWGDSQPAEVMDSGDHPGENVGLSSRNCGKVRSAGASVLPSQHRSGDSSTALRDGSISPFPAETLPKEGLRQMMGKQEKEVRENKQPSRNPLHAEGWFVLQGLENLFTWCQHLGNFSSISKFLGEKKKK